jgi:hypothetical protein
MGRRISQAIDYWPQVVTGDVSQLASDGLCRDAGGDNHDTGDPQIPSHERAHLQAVSGGSSTLQLVAEPASEGTDRRSLRPFYFSFASSRAAAFQRLRVKPASAKRRQASRSPRWKRSSAPNSCSEPHEASRSPTRDRPSTTARFGLRRILPPLRPCSATMRADHRALFT